MAKGTKPNFGNMQNHIKNRGAVKPAPSPKMAPTGPKKVNDTSGNTKVNC